MFLHQTLDMWLSCIICIQHDFVSTRYGMIQFHLETICPTHPAPGRGLRLVSTPPAQSHAVHPAHSVQQAPMGDWWSHDCRAAGGVGVAFCLVRSAFVCCLWRPRDWHPLIPQAIFECLVTNCRILTLARLNKYARHHFGCVNSKAWFWCPDLPQ